MIHVENLTKQYDDLCAVDQISFDIQKGEILGLLGPNGAGKTTTLRMLTGFLQPTSGDIRVKDFTIKDNALEIKNLLGYLPESAPLYYDMLVFDYLSFIADIRHIEPDEKLPRLKKIAELCGLNGVMHKPINDLSKGYKQRVGLAHAMMSDPEILVLDEATSGLDPNQIIEIRDIIKEIGKQKTIILSTHILSEAEATCDRIVIINEGKIVADGTPETLKQKGDGNYHINISLKQADVESVKTELGNISGIQQINKVQKDDTVKGALHLNITCNTTEDIRAPIYNRIKQTEWVLLDFHQETQSLEHIFQELTREN